MEARLQRRIQRYGWDRAQEYYEKSWQQQLQPSQTLLLDMAGLRRGERVLDVACGTGLVTVPAATRVGPDGYVLATDISARMVDACSEAVRDQPQVEVRRSDGEALEVEDEAFDCALCALGLMYMPEPTEALERMHRALKSGGRAVVSVWGERSQCGWAEMFPIVDARVASPVCPLFFQLGTNDALAVAFEAAGFRDVVLKRIDVPLHYDSAANALEAIFAGGPVALAYFKFDDDTRAAVHDEYLASIDAFRSGDGYDIPGQFVVGVGVK